MSYAKNPDKLIVSVTQGEGQGAEEALVQLLRGWTDPHKEFCVLAPVGSRVLREASELNIRSIGFPAKRDSIFLTFRAVQKVYDLLPRCRVVHGWTARTYEIAYYLSKKPRARFTCTQHDHPTPCYERKRRHLIVKLFGTKSSMMACVSNAVMQECRRAGYKNPMIVAHNGILDRGQVTQSSAGGPVRIAFLGMTSPMKGFSTVRSLIESTRDLSPIWYLYGSVSKELKSDSTALTQTYPENVFVMGRKPIDEIFRDTDILVHASTMFDSLPTVLIEAAMYGLPSIASDYGGASEIVRDGYSGYLFPPVSVDIALRQLRMLIVDKSVRAAMGDNARQIYREYFIPERMVNLYHELWEGDPP